MQSLFREQLHLIMIFKKKVNCKIYPDNEPLLHKSIEKMENITSENWQCKEK